MNDKEKLRMAKILVKSNNKKIKEALEYIEKCLDEVEMENGRHYDLLTIKEILKK